MPIYSFENAHRDLSLWFNGELSDNDVTSCLWITKDEKSPKVLLISCYWDIFLEKPPKKLDKAVEMAKRDNYSVVLGMDSNAHSTLTGSEETNIRGRHLQNFIMRHNLEIANKGNKPTFDSHLGQSVIDVTLVSPDIADRISDWKVVDEENFSDHKTIQFGLDTPQPEIQMKRNYAKLDINEFKERLSNLSAGWIPPTNWCLEEIEQQERKANELITQVLDELIPLNPVKVTPNWLNWWTNELEKKKTQIKKMVQSDKRKRELAICSSRVPEALYGIQKAHSKNEK